MKKALLTGLIVLVSVGSLFAQGRGPGNGMGLGREEAQTIEVEGTLAVVNGMIALKAKDTTYYVRGFQHLVGFIDGLKEGAKVKVSGSVAKLPLAPEYAFLRADKLVFNGKEYDLERAGRMGFGRGEPDMADCDTAGNGRGRFGRNNN